MQQQLKTRMVAIAAMLCSIGTWAQEEESPQLPQPLTQEVTSVMNQEAKEASSEPVQNIEEQSAQESKVRFVTKQGTGSSKTISKAPEVTFPKGPLDQPAGDVNQLIEQAKQPGGIALDPIQREINMPGLKKDDPTLKPFVLHTRNGVNEIVKLSSHLLNRLATPFKKPVLIDTTDVPHKIVGSDIYYMPAGNNPIGLYITDATNTSQTISLTIIPDSSIPGQNLIIKMEDLRALESLSLAAASVEEAAVMQPKASDYTSFVRSLMTQAVRGQIPGFSPVPLEGGVARLGELTVTPELVFTGSVLDIYRYQVENAGLLPMDLAETAFAREGVKAVSFFPLSSLEPGQQSYVFLLAGKPNADTASLAGGRP